MSERRNHASSYLNIHARAGAGASAPSTWFSVRSKEPSTVGKPEPILGPVPDRCGALAVHLRDLHESLNHYMVSRLVSGG